MILAFDLNAGTGMKEDLIRSFVDFDRICVNQRDCQVNMLRHFEFRARDANPSILEFQR